jgi:carbamoyltransferase
VNHGCWQIIAPGSYLANQTAPSRGAGRRRIQACCSPGATNDNHIREILTGVIGAEDQLRQEGFTGQFPFLSHHLCHAASAFNVSPFDSAAVAVIDGIGEWASTSLYHGEGRHLEMVREFKYPNSLGFLWEKLSMYLGFSKYDASKVMGLAAYGDAGMTRNAFASLVPDSRQMLMDASIMRHESPDFAPLEKLFGLACRSAPLEDVEDAESRAYADIAAGLQSLTEEVVLNILNSFDRQRYRYLCMAGGVALNCAVNGRIVREDLFDNIFIQPVAHDAGTAMGAVLLIWNEILGKERHCEFHDAYLGPEYSDTEVEAALKQTGLEYSLESDIAKAVAGLLADGNIVGWFSGRMEWGPRALGARSLLADPRREDMRQIMNAKVKHREPYRPLCPSVLAEHASDWFDSGKHVDADKYMLTTAYVLPEKRELIPAVLHADGSVRAQHVHQTENPGYHRLISEFEALTGIPLVLNTSFNDSEPIVCSPQDAINTFQKTDIDYLAMGDFLVSKNR